MSTYRCTTLILIVLAFAFQRPLARQVSTANNNKADNHFKLQKEYFLNPPALSMPEIFTHSTIFILINETM
ncbi:MAG: hypothetical protein V1799_07260 [bacterium]